ncbi:MAG: dienelactone hydrolase family protein [Pseudomonadota bacterium]
MCDENTIKESDDYLGKLSRREFTALAAGSAMAMMLPRAANALAVTSTDVEIETPDGVCDALFVHPAEGQHPAVLMWPDILALRPAFRKMATRLAESGYAVLCVNPYYRDAKSPVVAEGESFGDQATREKVMPMYRNLSAQTHQTDAKAFVAWLDEQSTVDTSRKVGTMGYCMGGPIIMRTAAAVPDRIGAAGSYHGGGLVTDRPDSPHLLIPQMKAQLLIAVADNDDERDPEAKKVLREEFAKNGLEAEIEVYEGAMHGWCVLDSRVYNHDPAEKAWARTLAMFERAL